ncbi:unnamed protein product [Phaedon cochleariae]|uniref:Amino acid transporter transmembrane domain-containing protein n=1 Tax=Phaedon cochleariae TaxID=80249 RepID=A0A9P0GX89_PHACE|nr:unnamed protein product [Phaedon cochleariae]
MQANERTFLLDLRGRNNYRSEGLSTFFAVICILDVFGVFPVVSLPKAIIDCGFYGVLVILIVCSTQIYTAALLGRCWIIAEDIFPTIHRRNRQPYATLAEITFGKKLSSFVTFLLDLTVFGGGIPNLIVASQNLQLLGLRISDGKTDISYCYWILITGTVLCPILWLGSPKDMKCLCSTSAGIVASVFILTCGCLIFSGGSSDKPASPESLDSSFPWQLILKAYGIIAFQFDIHPSILTIQVDMIDKTQLTKALFGGFSATILMFGITTVLAALKYGVITQPSILETLPTTIPLHLAAALIAIQLCLTSAVSNSALYQQMEDCMQISREFNTKRCILRTTLTILAIVIAESVPQFDLVMSLIGGAFVAPFAFILPPIMFLKMKSLRTKHLEELTMSSITNIVLTKGVEPSQESISRYIREDLDRTVEEWPRSSFFEEYLEVYVCVFIVFASTILTAATSYINIANAANSYSDMSNPCIYNISKSLLYW